MRCLACGDPLNNRAYGLICEDCYIGRSVDNGVAHSGGSMYRRNQKHGLGLTNLHPNTPRSELIYNGSYT